MQEDGTIVVPMDWKRRALAIVARWGYDPYLIDAYTRIQEPIAHDFDVDPSVREFTPSADELRGDVLLPLTQGSDAVVSYSYCILAHAFRVRGYRPIVPLCNADLDLCIKKEHRPDDLSTCALCTYYGENLLEAFGIDYLRMGDASAISESVREIPADDIHSVEYRGVDVSGRAKATARRFLKKRLLDYDDPYEREVYRRFLRSGMDIVDYANELFDRYGVRATVAHHPTYIYGGLYLSVAEQRDVPAITVQPGYSDQTLHFGNYRNRSGLPQFTPRDRVEEFIQEPLSEEQTEEIDRLMDARSAGEGVRIHPSADSEARLGLGDYENVVGLFTNLMWDASLEAEAITFTSAYSWVSTTIEYLRHQENAALVIKAHPAEEILRTEVGMVKWIRDNYDPLPENVVLLPPDTDVSPYKLMNQIDAGVVFNSTLGLEMPYYGVPVVVVSDTHYRGLGFTYDASTVEEYFDLLDSLDELEVTDGMRARARRYAHFLLVRKQIVFPFYTQNGTEIELLPVNHEDVADSEVFDAVVEAVLADDLVLTPELEVID